MPDSPPGDPSTPGCDTYEGILADLPPQERRIVHDVVTSGAIEGYMPDL